MNTTLALMWIAQALTAVLASVVARRRPQHRAFAAWAAIVLAADLGRFALNAGPLHVPGPYRGELRALFHLEQLGLLADPVGLVVLAWTALLYRRPWVPLGVGLVVFAALVIGYPVPFRGTVLGQAYAFIQGAAIVAVVGCFAAWFRRRAHPRPEHAAVLFVAAINACMFLDGPFGSWLPEPWAHWHVAQYLGLLMWAGLAAMQIASLTTGLWLNAAPPRGGLGAH